MNIIGIYLLLGIGMNMIAGIYVFYKKRYHLIDIAIDVNEMHLESSSTKMNIIFTIYNNLDRLFYLRNEASLLTNDGFRIPFLITTGNSRFIIPPQKCQTISAEDINIPIWSKRQFISKIIIENINGYVYRANIPRQVKKSLIKQQVINTRQSVFLL